MKSKILTLCFVLLLSMSYSLHLKLNTSGSCAAENVQCCNSCMLSSNGQVSSSLFPSAGEYKGTVECCNSDHRKFGRDALYCNEEQGKNLFGGTSTTRTCRKRGNSYEEQQKKDELKRKSEEEEKKRQDKVDPCRNGGCYVEDDLPPKKRSK